MSWSVDITGTPDAVCRALDAHVETSKLSGDAKKEFEGAKPHLAALVRMNHNPLAQVAVRLVAGGSASVPADGSRGYESLYCEIRQAGRVVT